MMPGLKSVTICLIMALRCSIDRARKNMNPKTMRFNVRNTLNTGAMPLLISQRGTCHHLLTNL